MPSDTAIRWYSFVTWRARKLKSSTTAPNAGGKVIHTRCDHLSIGMAAIFTQQAPNAVGSRALLNQHDVSACARESDDH